MNKKQILEEIRESEKAHDFLNFDRILKEGASKHEFDHEKIEAYQMKQRIANRVTNSYKVHERQRDEEMVRRLGIMDMWDY